MSRFDWLYAPGSANIGFALRTCVAVGLALYLAFWLQLQNPHWAIINVVILAQPLSGYLVVRGFARLIGTAVAATAAIVLIALFAQSYMLFSVALTLWLGLTVFFATLFRNNRAYGFVLAGYVAAIISVPAMGDPSSVFDLAVARTAETALAVVVTAAVGVLTAPGASAKAYFGARLAVFRAVGGQCRQLGDEPETTSGQRPQELAALQDLAGKVNRPANMRATTRRVLLSTTDWRDGSITSCCRWSVPWPRCRTIWPGSGAISTARRCNSCVKPLRVWRTIRTTLPPSRRISCRPTMQSSPTPVAPARAEAAGIFRTGS